MLILARKKYEEDLIPSCTSSFLIFLLVNKHGADDGLVCAVRSRPTHEPSLALLAVKYSCRTAYLAWYEENYVSDSSYIVTGIMSLIS